MCAFGATLPAKRVTVKVSKPPNSADFDAAVRVGFGAEVRARTVAAGWLKSADSGPCCGSHQASSFDRCRPPLSAPAPAVHPAKRSSTTLRVRPTDAHVPRNEKYC